MICVSLGKINYQEAQKIADRSEMIEIRADLLDWTREEFSGILNIPARSIFTFRPSTLETEEDRLDMYRFAVENGADYIDVEMEAPAEFLSGVQQFIKNTRTELIVSYHNFDITPSLAELKIILEQCYTIGANVAKIASMVHEPSDAAVLCSLFREPGRKVIVGMGEKGKIVRVASLLLGAEFTFAAPDKGALTAPGQLTVKEMEQIYDILKPI